MMPKRSHTRRPRKNGNRSSMPANVERQVQTIKTQLVGRMTLFPVSTGSTGVIAEGQINLAPLALGDRPGSVAAAFNRYKINWMRFSWKSRLPSTVAGKFYMGVSDDLNVASPATAQNVLNYRCSRECDVWKDCTLTWVPVDRKRWAYIRAETSNSDGRLINYGTFTLIGDSSALGTFSAPGTGSAVFSALTTTPIGTVDVEYSYVFDGASDDQD